jgi:hypothetical protein
MPESGCCEGLRVVNARPPADLKATDAASRAKDKDMLADQFLSLEIAVKHGRLDGLAFWWSIGDAYKHLAALADEENQ